MKVLIAFYSQTGKTKLVAERLKEILNANLEELIDNKKRSGIVGFISAIFDARFKKTTQISPIQFNPANFDIVIIGTPIWAGMPVPAVRTYLNYYAPQINRIAFFCTYHSSNSQGTFKELEQIANKTPVATLALSAKDFDSKKFPEKIKTFVESLK
ncbi:MAG: hypothetical protein ABIK73_02960 [candidate division WOR-3 bacterium]